MPAGWCCGAGRGRVLMHTQVAFTQSAKHAGKPSSEITLQFVYLLSQSCCPTRKHNPLPQITRNNSLALKAPGSPFGLEPETSRSQKCKWAALLYFTQLVVPTTFKAAAKNFLANCKSLPYPHKEMHQWQYFVELDLFLICCISDAARHDKLDGRLQQSTSISWISGTPLDS